MVSVLKAKDNRKVHRATPTEVKRHKVLALLEFGCKPADICAKMGYSSDLVRLVDKKRKSGQSLAPNFKGGTRLARTDEFMQKVSHIFDKKPEQNYHETARELGVSEGTVRQAAKELGFKSYKHRHRALLTTQIKIKRLERCEELLVWLSNPFNKSTIIIFSDKKLWDVDQHKNRQNHRYIAKSIEKVPPKWCSKNPASAMCLG